MNRIATVPEVIASIKKDGAYDFPLRHLLVRNNNNLYVFLSCWCGGDVEGQCYREHVWMIPSDWESRAKEAFSENGQKVIPGGYGMTDFDLFRDEVLSSRECLAQGRAANLKWAKNV